MKVGEKMLRIQQLKLNVDHTITDLETKISKTLRLRKDEKFEYRIYRRSVDARKKDQISFVYHVDVFINNEAKYAKIKNIVQLEDKKYKIDVIGTKELAYPPVIVGSGPAGLFCGLELARLGYQPIIIERGKPVDQRLKDIEDFWDQKQLHCQSNVQFGEGGAGTFSDGKLNTLVKDKNKRGRKVLSEFVKYGAPEEILYSNKPHIGTDNLQQIIPKIREEIISQGGQVLFEHQLTDIHIEDSRVIGITINGEKEIPCEQLVLAIGHSARDTFELIKKKALEMEAKAFAIGVRIEHPQGIIDKSQYGSFAGHKNLGASDYKLKHQCKDGRAVYSFCMCPGGVVVPSASEDESVVTNGMSYYKRDKDNANSALLVSVTPDDFPTDDVLAGVEFQRIWEKKAYEVGGSSYKAPAQKVGDFLRGKPSKGDAGTVKPSYASGVVMTDLRKCLPSYIANDLKEGLFAFDRKIKGFAMPDAIMTGVESRSSSPVRILRDKEFQSNIRGIYPIGEGAGYAGGIMSAAMDGLKIVEDIAQNYKPLEVK